VETTSGVVEPKRNTSAWLFDSCHWGAFVRLRTLFVIQIVQQNGCTLFVVCGLTFWVSHYVCCHFVDGCERYVSAILGACVVCAWCFVEFGHHLETVSLFSPSDEGRRTTQDPPEVSIRCVTIQVGTEHYFKCTYHMYSGGQQHNDVGISTTV
jgi:hypothetical protein